MLTLTRVWTRDTRLWPWLLALFGLSLGDCATTLYGLHIGMTEANFLATAAFAGIGVWPALALKELITAIILTFHAWSAIYLPRAIRLLVMIECAVFAFVVLRNLLFILGGHP